MWETVTLVLLAGASAAETARFAFELDGTWVGTVQLSRSGERYAYQSRQLFTHGWATAGVTRAAELTVDDASRIRGTEVVPESLWLWKRPAPGCRTARDELGGAEGELCVVEAAAGRARGSVFGERFEADYGPDDRLVELRLGHGRFVRLEVDARVAPPPDLFGQGFPIDGTAGALSLEPPAAAATAPGLKPWQEAKARALVERVHDTGAPDGAAEGRCLALARRYVVEARALGGDAAVVIGLVADKGRAYPHAWVRVGLTGGRALELDPSSLGRVAPETHLALPGAGKALLELLAGKARVVRRLGAR